MSFVEKFISKFVRDETTRLAASLAFYAALSLAPLLILFVTIAAQFSVELQSSFLAEVENLVGSEAATVFEMVIESAKTRPDLTSVAGLFGGMTLLLSASLIFGELRGALNRIFEVSPPKDDGESLWRAMIIYVRDRVLHIGLALIFVLVVIVSLITSSIISATVHSHVHALAVFINIAVSLLFYFALFSVTFRYLPDRAQPWARALRGGAFTAGLFVIGKELIAIYLGKSAVGSPYGAAGSFIALLVWVYYSTMITFVGAQLSALVSVGPRSRPT